MKVLLLCLFVGVLVYSGLTSMRKARTVNEFFLGGREVGPWLSAFAYGTTYFSAVIFIGYAGKVGWGFGVSGLWIVIGNTLLGSLLAWLVLAKRTRDMTIRLGAMTMPEFLKQRYNSPGLKFFSALVIFIFMVPYSASVYMGLSYLFEQIFNIPYIWAALGMAALTALYLIMGGYRAVAITDLIQGAVMVFGVGMLLYFVLGAPQVGGLAEGLRRLKDIDPGLAQMVPQGNWLALASLVMLTSLGPWGLPQMVQKFYAIKDERAIKPAMIVASVFAMVITFGAYFTGSLTHLFFDKMPVDSMTGKANPDLMMPQIINGVLPELGAAIILLLVLSASMSTLASLVLVSSSALTIDLFQSAWPKQTQKHGVTLMRLMCLVFIVVSVLLAMLKPAIILSLMAMSWGTVAGVFLAPYIFGLFWRGATTAGAWAAAVTGLVISVVLSLYFKMDAAFIPQIGCLAMIVPLFVLPAVSAVTRPLSEDSLKRVFGSTRSVSTKTFVLKGKEVET